MLAGGSGLENWRGLALAIALGLLVGIQRGWVARNAAEGSRIAGVRTFGLLGLAGGMAGAVFPASPAIAAIVIAACAAVLVIGYLRTTDENGRVSATGTVTGLLTVTCGFLAANGQPLTASAIAVAIVLLLSMRSQLHRFVGMLSEREVIAIGRFALIALVILPILPDAQYGPYAAWNPRELWLVVVLVSGLSLAGYLGARLLGPSRGLLLTALAGSLVSSTAVTAALAARLKEADAPDRLLNAGIALASATMCLRLIVLIAILARFALPTFAMIAAPAFVIGAAAAVWLARGAVRPVSGHAESGIGLRNPFALAPALLLTALVMAITVLSRWMLDRFGDSGVAAVLAISGMFDSDSTVIAMGHMPPGTLEPRIAGVVLVVPIVLNSLVKAGITLAEAGPRQGRTGAAILGATALAAFAPVPFLAGWI